MSDMLEQAIRDVSMVLCIDEESMERDWITMRVPVSQSHSEYDYEVVLPYGTFQVRMGVPLCADDTYNGGWFRFAVTLPNGRVHWSDWIESRTYDEEVVV